MMFLFKNSKLAMAATLCLLVLSAQHSAEAIGTACSSAQKKGNPAEYQAFFYGGKDFNSDCLVLDLKVHGNAVGMAKPQNFPKKNHYSSVKWNFPEGFTMSIFSSSCDGCDERLAKIYNKYGYELVGTGSVESFSSLGAIDLNNQINSWLWFTYETKIGYVKACRGTNYQGICRSIFLELFDINEIHNAENWESSEKFTSMDWTNLGPFSQVTFYEKRDGKPGATFNQAFGWNPNKKIPDLSTAYFDDSNDFFKWTQIQPVKEEFENGMMPEIELTYAELKHRCTTYYNDSPVQQEKEITVDWTGTLSFSTTVEKSDTYGLEVTVEMSLTSPKGTGGPFLAVDSSFSSRYTDSTEKFEEVEETKEISITEVAIIPPFTTAYICLTVSSADLPTTTIPVSVWRWYKEPVTGGVQDPDNYNFYKVFVEDATTVGLGGASALYTEMYVGPRSAYSRHRSLASSNIVDPRMEQEAEEDASFAASGMTNSTKIHSLRGRFR